MENENILQSVDEQELVEEESLLSQVTGGSAYGAVGGLAIATGFGAGVGALMGSSSGGGKGAGTGAGIGAATGLGLAAGLGGLTKWAESSKAAKKLR